MYSEFDKKLEKLKKQEGLPKKVLVLMKKCYDSYRKTTFVNEKVFSFYLDEVEKQIKEPYHFAPFHKKVRKPIDYQKFGIDFMTPLIVLEQSRLKGEENLTSIEKWLAAGENVILLANHQTEPDPQIIFIMLQEKHPKLADEMIFIAGDRVVTDPMSVPFSMGCNLLCIYSKKHIENPPELKANKLKHNQRTMKILSELLSEGGKCVYVAPSGGRDRPDKHGVVTVAPFDASSLEMLRLTAIKSQKPTHFFPLALSTYDILPPPNSVDVELGEERKTKRAPAHLFFGKEIDMDTFPGSDEQDKKLKRQKRAGHIYSLVKDMYKTI